MHFIADLSGRDSDERDHLCPPCHRHRRGAGAVCSWRGNSVSGEDDMQPTVNYLATLPVAP